MILLKKPQEITGNIHLKGLIYGIPGVGKTTLSLSSPNPVIIDTDKGLYRVETQLQCSSLQVEKYQEVLDLIGSNELDSFETLIIDSFGELLMLMNPWIIKNNSKNSKNSGGLSQQGYGARKEEFLRLLSLISHKQKHIIFVAHQKSEKNGDDKLFTPEAGGSSGEDLMKRLDFVGYMEMINNKRSITFSPTDRFYAKNSLQLDNYIEIPHTKNGNTFINDRIIKPSQERLSKNAELRIKYDDIISTGTKIIKDNDLEVCRKLLGELNIIWDSKIKLAKLLSEKAEQAGYIFNKEVDAFIKKVII